MYKIIGVVLGLLIASNAMANVVFNGDFETGDHSQWDELEWNTSRPEAEQFEIVTSPKREGQYSAKMTVHDGDEFESTGGERVQLERPGTYNENDGDEYWYSWSTYFPSDWQNLTGSPDDDWLLIADWHSTNPGPFEDVCQPLQFEINGQNQIIVRMITGNVEGYDCYDGPGTANYFDQVIVDSLNLGEWNDFVVHIKWKADNTGLLEVWHKSGNETNFTRVLNRENIPTLQYIGANIDSPYFILAHYRSEQQSHTSVLYQDGFKQMSSVGDLDEADFSATDCLTGLPEIIGTCSSEGVSSDSSVSNGSHGNLSKKEYRAYKHYKKKYHKNKYKKIYKKVRSWKKGRGKGVVHFNKIKLEYKLFKGLSKSELKRFLPQNVYDDVMTYKAYRGYKKYKKLKSRK